MRRHGWNGARLGSAWTIGHLAPREIPRIEEVAPDWRLAVFGLAVGIFAGLIFGIVPALRASGWKLNEDLKVGASGSHHRSLKLLVAAEIALAFVLVLGGGLLGKSYLRLMSVDSGFDPQHLLTVSLMPDNRHYDGDEKHLGYYDRVAGRVLQLPGVETAGYSSTLPLSTIDTRGLYIRERPVVADGDAPRVEAYFVSPDYFRAMCIPLLRGRYFSTADSRNAARVAIVSESCARANFGGEEPLGKHIQVGTKEEDLWATVVGIVGDIHQYGLDRPADPAAYLPFSQPREVQSWARLVVRSSGDPKTLEVPVANAMRAVDPLQPVFHLQSMSAYIKKSVAQKTFTLILIALFGGLALVLATVGIYGVVSYTVRTRTKEVGIRMALGAEPRKISAMVLRDVSGMLVRGLAAGFVAALALTRLLAHLLYRVEPNDLPTTAVVASVLIVVALAAGYFPARRAARLDPSSALRCE